MKKTRNRPCKPMKQRLVNLMVPEPNTGCWLFLGQLYRNGYGKINVAKKTTSAHRVSYETFKGEIGELWVLHKCDTPCCINPDHLFLGTRQDNVDDMMRKGRKQASKKKKATP